MVTFLSLPSYLAVLALRCQLILLQCAHHIDDAFVYVGQLDIRERPVIGGANILEDHALTVRLIHRQRGGTLQLADLLRGLRPRADQRHDLTIQFINLLSPAINIHALPLLCFP